jgi:two-component system, NtrC family, sensor kinase
MLAMFTRREKGRSFWRRESSLLTADAQDRQEQWTEMAQRRRLADIGTLAASVAHELNNPISIITSACSSLEAQAEDESLSPEALRRQLQIIEQSAWRCARLIHALRSYAHPDMVPVPSDLNTLVEDGLTLVAYQFERQDNIAFHQELAADLPPGLWEPNQITQVLINLLINARDALQPDGGTITIRSWQEQDSSGETHLLFSVEDTGPGIAEENLPFIFDPFFTTKRVGEGTGLGLSIAAEIVARHQGKMWAESSPQGGARLTVSLPCRPGPQTKEPDGYRPAH